MRIIICDDYPVIVKNLIRDIKQIVPQAECAGFSKAKEAQEYVLKNAADVAILDINMPEISGLTLAQIIQKKNPRVNIIFVTGYPEYALEAHELYASSFLVKPVTAKALKKAFENLRNPVANLTGDVIQNFYEGKILHATLYEMGKSMTEQISKAEQKLAAKEAQLSLEFAPPPSPPKGGE